MSPDTAVKIGTKRYDMETFLNKILQRNMVQKNFFLMDEQSRASSPNTITCQTALSVVLSFTRLDPTAGQIPSNHEGSKCREGKAANMLNRLL